MDIRINMCNTKTLRTLLTAAKIDGAGFGAFQGGTSPETVVRGTEGAHCIKRLARYMAKAKLPRRKHNIWSVQLPGYE